MTTTCSKCGGVIPPSQMNVSTNVAVCPGCGEVLALSDLVSRTDRSDTVDLQDPPNGAWFQEDLRGWRIGASTRSAMAFFLVPFMMVWSGFSLGGIYGTQIMEGEFDLSASLFGIPFVLGTLLFGSIAAMTVFGRVEVSVQDHLGRVFTGVGPIGWSRKFDWSEVREVVEEMASYQSPGNHGTVISLVGKTRLKFGSMVNDTRRYFLVQGLEALRRRS